MGLGAGRSLQDGRKGTPAADSPREASGAVGGPYAGPMGAGYASALVWRVVLEVDGELGTWAALVDAHTGEIRSFDDINDYAQAKGGVYPVSNDQIPPDGVEQANWPMPFANITIGVGAADRDLARGSSTAPPAARPRRRPSRGPYVRVVDTLRRHLAVGHLRRRPRPRASAGTDCAAPGCRRRRQHARVAHRLLSPEPDRGARALLAAHPHVADAAAHRQRQPQPDVQRLLERHRTVNFFKSGGGCRNTGEIAGIFLHEWGHGLDYERRRRDRQPRRGVRRHHRDAVDARLVHRTRLRHDDELHGYGDACLNCTGIRDQDWDQRTRPHAGHAVGLR